MRRPARTALLLAAALAAGGCAFTRTVIPLDASGMEFPARHFSGSLADQVERTGERITSLPGALGSHVDSSWRNLTAESGMGTLR